MARHHTVVVRPGDCIESLAAEIGCAWSDLWDHPRNETLRRARSSPSLLAPGDVVQIPEELWPRPVALPKGGSHRYRCAPPRTTLRVRVQRRGDDGVTALASAPFRVTAAGVTVDGTTTAEGDVVAEIPVEARSAHVVVAAGTPDERSFVARIGHLDPIDAPRGIAQRLAHLGLLGPLRTPDALRDAVARFQHRHGLEPTGELDAETIRRIRAEHDGE